ncbi:protein FAM161A [Aplysia californica]|uniref:Protein FAM161A n=1 Tax=Aplysia californica TaxID=6500 RepID=A0ABM0K914_APLCA|nr:protein FAM161A [Aplysia californica]
MYMATMASTSHGLSVWANACVKNPINPKTGLSSTLPERSRISIRFDDALNEVERARLLNATVSGDGRDWARESLEGKDVNSRLQAATEQEFYEKLQQLKEENRKTIEAYDKLYKEKILLEGIQRGQTTTFQPDKSGVDREVENNVLGLDGSNARNSGPVTKKPPPGKPCISTSNAPIFSRTVTHRSDTAIKSEQPPLVRSRSLDEGDLKLDGLPVMGSKDSDDFLIQEGNMSEYEKALEKVDKLWEDFKISEYTQRRHSFSSNERKRDIEKKEKEWRHRITIPQPFSMSIREALKDKKKTKAQVDLEIRRLEKQRLEEEECAKKFKAQPVPSHVYLPLYEEIMEKNETRRKYAKEYCQDLLKSQVKPFNFEIREQEKKAQRVQSAPVKRPEKKVKTTFKAKPVPKNVFNTDVDEKLMEDEELRKIRVRMRAKELLRESSLPPNMAAREKLKEQQKKEEARKAKKNGMKKQRPRSAHVVPDYDLLYREFQKELARRKTMREGTVVEPFELETARIRQSSQEKIQHDIEEDERRLREGRWPFSGSRTTPRSSMKYLGALSTSLDSIPTSSTKAAQLRTTVVQKEKEKSKNRQKEEEESERRRKAREARLRRYLNEKTSSDEMPHPRESIATRLKRMKQDDRARQEAYQREIQEMRARVEQSPLLVEKFMAENAKKEAEKKFSTTVRQAGFSDAEFSSGQKSGSSSFRHEDEDQFGTGSADLTYTKGTDEDEYEEEQ